MFRPSATFEMPDTTLVPELTEIQQSDLIQRIHVMLREKNAVLITHYYTDPILQALTEETGGIVSDSLEMARFGHQHPADILVVVGVRFMGETAKILSPHKKVLMPSLDATCSLDLGCPIKEFSAFCDQHPERTVVVYANTAAAVKARADWVVTSSIACDVVDHLTRHGEKLIWAPDRHLGHYIQNQTGADMVVWGGACVVHEEFKANGIQKLQQQYPEAGLLVHPEAPKAVIALADVVGSTSRLIKATFELPHTTFIVATDRGIFYKMQQAAPHKLLLEAPTSGHGATCKSCGHCPWMAMNHLQNLYDALQNEWGEIILDGGIIQKARKPIERMLHFTTQA